MKAKMKTMKDAAGNEIPLKYVNQYDRARDAATRRVLERFLKCRKALETLARESLADVEAVRKLATRTGIKGNYQISSFDGLIVVSIEQSYSIRLDDHVAEARELMFNYAKRLVGNIDGNDSAALLQILETAFRATRNGALPYGKILELMRLNINDSEWQKARDLLSDAIKPEPGKRYLRCAVRPDRQHDAENIKLDLADCWPDDANI